MRLQTIELDGPSGKECYGTYNSTSQTGYGPGYQYNCIHSGTIKSSGDLPTTWYNYALATAGTISEETGSEHPAVNTIKATESVCPKGWTLPNNAQIRANRDVLSFSPVLGGYYGDGALISSTTYGLWWGSEASNSAVRNALDYFSSGTLYTLSGRRTYGFYIRCVQAP